MIYEKTLATLGGKENIEQIKSIYAEGFWNFPDGEEIRFIYKYLVPEYSRFDFSFEEKIHTISNYGDKGWTKNTGQVLKGYEHESKAAKTVVRNSFFYENNLIDFKRKGLKLEFEGSVKMGDKESWVIRVLGFSNKEELYYISTKDNRVITKQSYYIVKDKVEVISYFIKDYMSIAGVLFPKTILVSSNKTNLFLRFSSYVINKNVIRSDFKNSDFIDFTTNSLDLTASEAQDYLHSEIPITRQMGIEVQTLTTNEVKLKAPIALNVNHVKSAFGGSVDSLFLTAGWVYMRLITKHIDPAPTIIGNKGTTTFKRPITSDFAAQIIIPSKTEVDSFLKVLEKKGKAWFSIRSNIVEDGKIYAIFTGDYVVIKDIAATMKPPGEP